MSTKARIPLIAENLLREADRVFDSLRKGDYNDYVDTELHAKWFAGCLNLFRIVGDAAKPFKLAFRPGRNQTVVQNFQKQRGFLKAIKEAIDNGLLFTVEELIFAEAFSDLLEQAEELLSKGFSLAAGVICRAVFEEHLRKLCDANGCMPEGKPTIEPLKNALVRKGVLSKLDAKSVDSIAAAGNHCAHNNNPPLTNGEIQSLIRNVTEFLVRHSLNNNS